ncbi:MAG: S-adenosylmethionine:tRNA ribosyltransferase-isomerase, partial [Bacteroidia bacterium]|nr:S-adenosylmethionine:tRNA ribosyltransferase-isomerase [Bacteroidia bacterium]MDW8334230.1 S-adenosylmethionine:tRNA ribosyltransferase-isomerase [Bacteroidia bacterium]
MYRDPILISEYDYDLPEDRIARYPPQKRGDSRWLIYRDGNISVDRFGEPKSALAPGTTLVFNDVKVIPARLFFETAQGKRVEVLCLRPWNTDYERAMSLMGASVWTAYVGGAKKWKSGKATLRSEELEMTAEVVGTESDARVIRFEWQPADWTFDQALEKAGKMPIPPYLRRAAEETDKERYQTCYARTPGAVAAPTAGLHFTPELMARLESRGVKTAYLTLYVGAGTFKPVGSENALE